MGATTTSKNSPALSPDLLISVHIPKTGGKTTARVLRRRFKSSLLLDYPLHVSKRFKCRRTSIEAVHGHFPLTKYLSDEQPGKRPRVMTFLREPLDRVVSHYYYWLYKSRLKILFQGEHPLYKKHFVEHRSSLQEFILDPMMSNHMTGLLQPLSAPEDFWFIGFQASYAQDSMRLQAKLSLPASEPPVINRGKPRPPLHWSQGVVDSFYELNKADKVLYDRLLAARARWDPDIVADPAMSDYPVDT